MATQGTNMKALEIVLLAAASRAQYQWHQLILVIPSKLCRHNDAIQVEYMHFVCLASGPGHVDQHEKTGTIFD